MSDSPPGNHGPGEPHAGAFYVDHAQGVLLGDRGVQSNFFSYVITANGDALAAGRDIHVQELHVHARDAGGQAPGGFPGGLRPVQAGLPAESGVFEGRDADLAKLLALLDPAASGTAPRVAVVSGMAGVGKTELALHAAHAAVRSGWFPAACCL
jgi:AAA ATPase domain